jgi:hypothetical protein
MATTKVQLTLDIEYDIHPSKYNKLEIQKILAFMCHEIQRDNLYSWADVEVTNYNYRINLNPYYNRKKYNNKDKDQKDQGAKQ